MHHHQRAHTTNFPPSIPRSSQCTDCPSQEDAQRIWEIQSATKTLLHREENKAIWYGSDMKENLNKGKLTLKGGKGVWDYCSTVDYLPSTCEALGSTVALTQRWETCNRDRDEYRNREGERTDREGAKNRSPTGRCSKCLLLAEAQ